MNIAQWITFWRAHPSAPETPLLWRLRLRFLLATFALFAAVLLPARVWQSHPALILLVPMLGLAALATGTRYFVAKATADDAHRAALIERTCARAREGERP